MRVISGLLERFKNIEPPERVVKDAVILTIKDIIGVVVDKGSIKINSRGTLFIATSAPIKASIFENKDNIISRINNILKNTKINNIN